MTDSIERKRQPDNSIAEPDPSSQRGEQPRGSERGRPYATPKLVSYGRLRSVTMGGSAGAGDSGAGDFIQKHP